MSKPLFSILVAHYNNAVFFKDCFESILNQTYKNYEVIILDDSSTQEELFVLKQMISGDDRFTLYENDQNRGVGFTKNKLIELCKGEICGFLDPDDSLMPEALEIMMKYHLSFPEASIINSNLQFCDQNLQPLRSSKVKQITQNDDLYFNLNGDISHFATFKINYYKKTSGIDPFFRIAEDQDLYLKLYEVGNSIQINYILYNYRLNPNSLTNMSSIEISRYWHWVAAIKAAERRNINIEELFVSNYAPRHQLESALKKLDKIKASKVYSVLKKLGLLKLYQFIK